MNNVFVLGVGIHRFGRFDLSASELGQFAALAALEDAGLAWKQVDAAYLASAALPPISGVKILKPMGATGIPICDVEAACASGAVALKQAFAGIQAGAIDVALVLGVEKMPRGFIDPAGWYEQWQIEMGLSTNPSYWALRARRHMHDHGTTEEQIATIAVKNHRHSVANPFAMYQKAFTLEEVLASPLVCDPIRLLEICSPNDGAAAVVLSSEKFKRQVSMRAVHLASCVHVTAGFSADLRVPIDSMSARVPDAIPPTTAASSIAYEQSGISPNEIDCLEVQDTDAFCEIEAYEHLGLCDVGDGGRLADDGSTALGGAQPVNVSGGLISKGEPPGASHLAQVAEITTQLRGAAGARQVEGARTALAHVLGGGGNCAVTVLHA